MVAGPHRRQDQFAGRTRGDRCDVPGSQAGVDIDLIVRGVCTPRPGARAVGKTSASAPSSAAFSTSSHLLFPGRRQETVHLSSAVLGWNATSSTHRTCSFPILDPKLKKRVITEGLKVHLADNQQGWEMNSHRALSAPPLVAQQAAQRARRADGRIWAPSGTPRSEVRQGPPGGSLAGNPVVRSRSRSTAIQVEPDQLPVMHGKSGMGFFNRSMKRTGHSTPPMSRWPTKSTSAPPLALHASPSRPETHPAQAAVGTIQPQHEAILGGEPQPGRRTATIRSHSRRSTISLPARASTALPPRK